MSQAITEGPVYYGVHHHLHHVDDGVLVRRTRERVSMVADRGWLDLTVVDDDGREFTVRLDAERVDSLIRDLPALRAWMVPEEAASTAG